MVGRPNTHVIRVPEKYERKKNGTKAIFKMIITSTPLGVQW